MVRVNIFIATIKVILIRNLMDVVFNWFSINISTYILLYKMYRVTMHVRWALVQWFNSHPMLNTCARHLNGAVIWLPHYARARQYLKRKFSELCVQFIPSVYLEEQEVFNSFSLRLAERAIFCFYRVEWFLVLEAIFRSKKIPRCPNESVKHKNAWY